MHTTRSGFLDDMIDAPCVVKLLDSQGAGSGRRAANMLSENRERVCVLFIGTPFSNLYTAVDTPTMGSVGRGARMSSKKKGGVLSLRDSRFSRRGCRPGLL
jgi:hypothetical protein